MALIEQYLQSVRTLLPRGEREDIIAELSANVAAQVEDRSAELGRLLSEDEEREILAQLGSPLAVAQKYSGGGGRLAFGREWIGPVLFPRYTKVLTLNVSLTFGVCVIVAVVLGWPGGFGSVLQAVLFQLLIQFAIVTGIFALAERHLSRLPGAPATPARLDDAGGGTVSRLEAFADLVALCGLFVAAAIVWRPFESLFVPDRSGLYLSASVRDAAVVVVVLAAAWTVQALVNLLRPGHRVFNEIVRAATSIAWLALLLYMLLDGLIVLVGPQASPGGVRAAAAANRSVSYTLVVLTVASVAWMVFQVTLAVRRARSHRSDRRPDKDLRLKA